MLVTLDTLRVDGDPGDSEIERSDKAHKNMNGVTFGVKNNCLSRVQENTKCAEITDIGRNHIGMSKKKLDRSNVQL